MKRLIITSFLALLFAEIAVAQYYTSTSGTLTGIGFVYNYKKEAGYIILHNANNQILDTDDWGHKDGTSISADVQSGKTPTFVTSDNTKVSSIAIVNNAFSPAQKILLAGEELMITMYFNSNTGHVMEVEFEFLAQTNFRLIPPEVYFNIERNLKNNIHFTVTPAGKKFRYLMVFWLQEVK